MENQADYRVNVREKQGLIIDHYGFDNQLERLVEESCELVQAICKYKRYKKNENKNLGKSVETLLNLVEELADVKNLIQQLEIDSDYIKEGIKRNIEYKVNRELERINRG